MSKKTLWVCITTLVLILAIVLANFKSIKKALLIGKKSSSLPHISTQLFSPEKNLKPLAFELNDSSLKSLQNTLTHKRLGILKSNFKSSKAIFIQIPHAFADPSALTFSHKLYEALNANLIFMNNNHKKFNDLNENTNINENFLLQITPKYVSKFPQALVLQIHSDHFPEILLEHPWMILTPSSSLLSSLNNKCSKLFPRSLKPLIKKGSPSQMSIIHKSCTGLCTYMEIHLNSKKNLKSKVIKTLKSCLTSPT